MTPVKFAGHTRYLNYSMAVLMDVDEKFGGVEALLDAFNGEAEGTDRFQAFAWAFVRMANDGEQKIANDGYESLPPLREEDLTAQMQPITYSRLQQAMVDEITLAYNHEYTEEESKEIDLGLAELRKKKESPARTTERNITLLE